MQSKQNMQNMQNMPIMQDMQSKQNIRIADLSRPFGLVSSLPSNLTVWPFPGVVPNAIALTTTHSVTTPGPGQMPFEGSHAIKIPQRWQQHDHKSESFEANWITGKNVNFNFTSRDCRHPSICLTSTKQTLDQYIRVLQISKAQRRCGSIIIEQEA